MSIRTWIDLLERDVSKPATNSLGRLIAQSPEGVHNFWTWFGRSKIMDRAGQPLVLYHGTKSSFRAFDSELSNSNTQTFVPQGTFVFTNSSDIAQSYAGQKTQDWGFATPAEEKQYRKLLIDDDDFEAATQYFRQHAVRDVNTFGDGGNVMPVYLRIVRPLRVNARGESWRNIYYQDDDWSTNDLMVLARSKGYDGLIVRNVYDRHEGSGPRGDIFAVFNPTQIKSAVANRGTFATTDLIDEDQ